MIREEEVLVQEGQPFLPFSGKELRERVPDTLKAYLFLLHPRNPLARKAGERKFVLGHSQHRRH